MIKKKYEKLLVQGLSNHFSSYGYKLSKKHEEYRFTNDTSEIRFLQRGDSRDYLYYAFHYYVHHDEIYPFIKRVTEKTMPAWLANTGDFYASDKEWDRKIAEQVNYPGLRDTPSYNVENEIDVRKILDHQKEYFNKVVLRYIRKFETLDSTYDFLAPYLINLNESQIQNKQHDALKDYFKPNDYMSLMISCWKVKRENYSEVWRRIDTLYDGVFIHKSFVFLDDLLRNENTWTI